MASEAVPRERKREGRLNKFTSQTFSKSELVRRGGCAGVLISKRGKLFQKKNIEGFI